MILLYPTATEHLNVVVEFTGTNTVSSPPAGSSGNTKPKARIRPAKPNYCLPLEAAATATSSINSRIKDMARSGQFFTMQYWRVELSLFATW